VHLLDDVDHQQSNPHSARSPPALRSSPSSPPSPIAPIRANGDGGGDKLNTSNPCDESFDPLESDASLDGAVEVPDEHLHRQPYNDQGSAQHNAPSRGQANRTSDLYAAISQSFFQPNEAGVGARVMHLEQCISSSQNLDAVPMQEVFSQLEAAFPRRGSTSEAREPATAATRRKVSPPSSGGSGERSSSADLLEDNRSPTASAVLPVLPVRSNDASPQYEKHDLRHWGIPDSVYALDRLYLCAAASESTDHHLVRENRCQTYAEHGVGRLYDWQVECLSQEGVMDGRNLVYSAPTSGGKTMGTVFF
jgi:hypothetical protein